MEFEVIHSMSRDIMCQNFYNMSNDMSSETHHIEDKICQVIQICQVI